jgi:uncharacterized protein (DUF427 family)
MKTKLCPMKTSKQPYESVKFGECDNTQCAWWNSYTDECAVNSIGYIGFMAEKIERTLKDKM